MLTAFATVESAVAAVKAGAFDYLAKPFSVDQLKVVVERALAQRNLAIENRNLRAQLQSAYGFENIVGNSAALREVLEAVRKAARSEASILVMGESGTGKELVARAIHATAGERPGHSFRCSPFRDARVRRTSQLAGDLEVGPLGASSREFDARRA